MSVTSDYVDITIYNFPIINQLELESYVYTFADANLLINKEFVINHYGTITPLSISRAWCGAASIGDYALFAGGSEYYGNQNDLHFNTFDTVDVYDSSLVHFIANNLSIAKSHPAATTVGDYALFAGGLSNVEINYIDGGFELSEFLTNTIDSYDMALTHSTPSSLSMSRWGAGATTVGDYALFAGGNRGWELGSYAYSNVVDAYDTSLMRSTPTTLSVGREGLTATTVGNYALFGGGRTYYDFVDVVDVYDESLMRLTPTSLSELKYGLAATTTGDYALFGGGSVVGAYNYSNTVDVYDTSLTRSNPIELSDARGYLYATTLNGYAFFAGGKNGSGYSTIIDVYDMFLTRTSTAELTEGGDGYSVSTVGDYAIFSGGFKEYIFEMFNTVDAYTVANDESAKYTWNDRSGETWNDVEGLTLKNFVYKPE